MRDYGFTAIMLAFASGAINMLFWLRLLDAWRFNNIWIYLIVLEASFALAGIAAAILGFVRTHTGLAAIGTVLSIAALIACALAPLPRNMGLP